MQPINLQVNSHEHTTLEETLLKKLNAKCSNRDVSSCMMLKLVTYFNRMLKKSSIEIGDLEITQTSEEVVTEGTSRRLNAEMSDEAQLSQLMADKVWSFVKTRSLKWKVRDSQGPSHRTTTTKVA